MHRHNGVTFRRNKQTQFGSEGRGAWKAVTYPIYNTGFVRVGGIEASCEGNMQENFIALKEVQLILPGFSYCARVCTPLQIGLCGCVCVCLSLYQCRSQSAVGPVLLRPQRNCGKVMFSQASVILFTGGCGRHPPARHPLDRYPPTQCMLGYTPLPSACWDTPPPPDSHCSRRYASYWNAFLFNCKVACF